MRGGTFKKWSLVECLDRGMQVFSHLTHGGQLVLFVELLPSSGDPFDTHGDT